MTIIRQRWNPNKIQYEDVATYEEADARELGSRTWTIGTVYQLRVDDGTRYSDDTVNLAIFEMEAATVQERWYLGS